MKQYTIHITEFYDIDIEAKDKKEAKKKALVEYANNPSNYFNGSEVTEVEEINTD